MRSHKRKVFIISLLLGIVLFLSRCIDGHKEEDMRGNDFAGSAACITCHKDIYLSFIKTAHYNTSSAPSEHTIKGSFETGYNIFEYADTLKVLMEEKNNVFFQTAYINNKKGISHSFDLVVGSGRKAQTYLYFEGDKIFQLPISYFVPEKSWANSPNYPSDHIFFERSIPSTCFGCHSSAIQVKKSYNGFQLNEEFEKGKIIYGIDCERCHGPAAQHVDFHTGHPEEKEAKYIAKINTMNRQQQLDMCALCHSGLKTPQRSAFQFRPGDSVSNFYYPDFARHDPSRLDVHGNQYQLLTASKCFRMSIGLTCSSCHNVHTQERDNLQLFSQRCIECHKNTQHDFVRGDTEKQKALTSNCIDCHMPLKPSTNITLLTRRNKPATPDLIRTHFIKVYPEETQKFLDDLGHHNL